MINIIFDQYQRYNNAKRIVDSIRKENESLKILEVGANEHKNLEKFLPNDSITYLDINLPENLLKDPKYILGDATSMDFKDNQYDIVIALDVYEHIPKDRRKNFINELYRVSSKIAIFSAPFNKVEVVLAEERVNTYYKTLTGVNHHWLYEHIDNGLPNLEKLKEYLNSQKIEYSCFAHGNIEVWEKLTNIQALIQLDKTLEQYISEIDKYYNKFLFENDYEEKGYRNFIILEKERNFKVKYNGGLDKSALDDLLDNLYRLLQVRSSMGKVKPDLPGYGDNIVRVYIDYGDGFKESETLYRYLDLSQYNTLSFNEFMSKKVKSIRIDPTEREGKFIFRELVVKNEKDEVINVVDFRTNSYYQDGDLYVFLKEDPQIIFDLENENISYIEFKIQQIKEYDSKEQLLQTTIIDILNKVKALEISNAELIKVSTESFIKKLKSKFK